MNCKGKLIIIGGAVDKGSFTEKEFDKDVAKNINFFEKGILMLGGSANLQHSGHYYFGDLSGINTSKIPLWFTPFFKPGDRISRIRDWDQKIEEILNGRSMQEFAFDILVPPVNWVASLISSLDRDTQFDELKSQLPITVRDNVFRNESGEGYYIKKAGVVYPLELRNNQWVVQIEGQWYKLSDVEGF